MENMVQSQYQKFICASGLVKFRFVTIDVANNTVAYTAAGAKPDGVTIGDESNLVIEVLLLSTQFESFWIDATGTITSGEPIQVGASGTAIVQTTGAIACYARNSAVSGSMVCGFNFSSGLLGATGNAATGSVAAESGEGDYHKTVLTVDTAFGAIAGGADLGLGKLVYTLPAGEIIVEAAYMSIALDEVDGNITADTPEVGLGSVVASGVVAVLSGTGTFEDTLTGKAAADCNGTPTVLTVADQVRVIAAAGAKTIYLNIADTWAASGETACPVAGTIVLIWRKMA